MAKVIYLADYRPKEVIESARDRISNKMESYMDSGSMYNCKEFDKEIDRDMRNCLLDEGSITRQEYEDLSSNEIENIYYGGK